MNNNKKQKQNKIYSHYNLNKSHYKKIKKKPKKNK